MNTTIQNNGRPILPQPATTQGGTAASGAPGHAGESAGVAAKAGDRVELTDSARALQEAAKTTDGAAIDTQRVEKIRQALADGSYKVDPARIADRMLSLDAQLGATKGSSQP